MHYIPCTEKIGSVLLGVYVRCVVYSGKFSPVLNFTVELLKIVSSQFDNHWLYTVLGVNVILEH